MQIYLFDVDGVLVEPRGYRLTIPAVIEHFCSAGAVRCRDSLRPTEEEISCFESCGVHDVWDISCILLADIIAACVEAGAFDGDGALAAYRAPRTGSLQHQSGAVVPRSCAPGGVEIRRPHYMGMAEQLASANGEGIHPPEAAKRLIRARLSGHSCEAARSLALGLIEQTLSSTREVYKNDATRLFQNILLGDCTFERIYGLAAEYRGPAILETEDRALLNAESAARLRRKRASGELHAAVYTARPSGPPADAGADPAGYSPEAELAVELAQMADVPLIAMGMMEWLGREKGEPVEALTKPHRTQALAALLCAINGGRQSAALEEAYAVEKEGLPLAETAAAKLQGDDVILHVFEDTVSGIVPLLSLGESLGRWGCRIAVVPHGIAVDLRKVKALAKYCQNVFPDINQAIAAVERSK